MVKIKDLAPVEQCSTGYSPFVEYQNLLFNGVKIIGFDYTTEQEQEEVDFKTEKIIKQNLFDGSVGYDKVTKKWANVVGVGLDDDGFPTSLRFIFKNGKTYSKVASYDNNEHGAYIIYATPNGLSFNALIKQTTDFMCNCDKAIKQNIEACKTPVVLAVKSKEMRESVLEYFEQKAEGKPVIIVDEDFGDKTKVLNLNAEFLADKFTTLKYDERDRLLNKLGIMSANTDKRERVQVGEVNATVGQCTDYIYLLIDSFNKQMKSYNIPFKMVANGSLEELYYAEEPETEQENKNEKVEEKENENE